MHAHKFDTSHSTLTTSEDLNKAQLSSAPLSSSLFFLFQEEGGKKALEQNRPESFNRPAPKLRAAARYVAIASNADIASRSSKEQGRGLGKKEFGRARKAGGAYTTWITSERRLSTRCYSRTLAGVMKEEGA